MSQIEILLKNDQRKMIEQAMKDFRAKGGEVRRMPAPSFYSMEISFLENTPVARLLQNKIRMQIAKANAAKSKAT